jgi:hypothetical protein
VVPTGSIETADSVSEADRWALVAAILLDGPDPPTETTWDDGVGDARGGSTKSKVHVHAQANALDSEKDKSSLSMGKANDNQIVPPHVDTGV